MLIKVHNKGCLLGDGNGRGCAGGIGMSDGYLSTAYAGSLNKLFKLCNSSVPLMQFTTGIWSGDFPLDFTRNYNASAVLDRLDVLSESGFILGWEPDFDGIHRRHFADCAPTVCQYKASTWQDPLRLLEAVGAITASFKDYLQLFLAICVPFFVHRYYHDEGAYEHTQPRSAEHSDRDGNSGRDSSTPRADAVAAASPVLVHIPSDGDAERGDVTASTSSPSDSFIVLPPPSQINHRRAHGVAATAVATESDQEESDMEAAPLLR